MEKISDIIHVTVDSSFSHSIVEVENNVKNICLPLNQGTLSENVYMNQHPPNDDFLPISKYSSGCQPNQCSHISCDNYIHKNSIVANPRSLSNTLFISSEKFTVHEIHKHLRIFWNSLIFTVSYKMLFRLQRSSSTWKEKKVYTPNNLSTVVHSNRKLGLHWESGAVMSRLC